MQNPANQNNKKQISLPRATNAQRVWLRVGTLIDGENKQPLRSAHIVYDSASIVYVAEEKNPPPSNIIASGQSQPDLDLPEFTLLPGLVEAHAHFFLEGGELNPEKRAANLKQPHAKLLEAADRRLKRLVPLGIAGVRDAGDKAGVGLSLSNLYSSAKRTLMPYVDSPGAAINHRGEYGSFMAEPIEDFQSPRDCVVSRIRNGSDRIKIIVSDVIEFKSGSVIKPPQMTASGG